MTKKSLLAMTILMGLGITAQAQAAEAGDLLVKGNITAGACHMDIPNNVIDYGDISISTIGGNLNQLSGAGAFDININCDIPTTYALRVADNRADSVFQGAGPGAGYQRMGLGLAVDAVTPIGYYTINPRKVQSLDGTISGTAHGFQMTYTENDGSNWNIPTTEWAFAKSGKMSQSWAHTVHPIAVSTMNFPFVIYTQVQDGQLLGQGTQLDGSATFTLEYL